MPIQEFEQNPGIGVFQSDPFLLYDAIEPHPQTEPGPPHG